MNVPPTSEVPLEQKPISRGPLGATISWISSIFLVLSFGYLGVSLFAICMFAMNYEYSGGYMGSVIGTAAIHVGNASVFTLASCIGIASGVIRNKMLQRYFSWAVVCMFLYICLVCGVLMIIDSVTYYYTYNIIL